VVGVAVAWVAACFSVPSRIRFSSSRGGGKLLQKLVQELARGPPEEEGLLQPLALQPQTLLAEIYQSEL